MIRIEEKNNYTEDDKKLLDKLNKFPIDYWDFKNTDTSELVHGIHSYPAMMIYPISRTLLQVINSIKKVDSLFDPFTGSGTVLVEGINSNINNIYGNDLNPLARLISKVKTTLINKNDLLKEKNSFDNRLNIEYSKYADNIEQIDMYMIEEQKLSLTSKDGWGNNAPEYLLKYYKANNIEKEVPNFTNLGFWFKPKVILELQIIKDEIKKIKNEDIRNIFLVAFSETIRLVSNRRNGEFKMYRMQPEKVEKFKPNVKLEFEKILNRNIQKHITFSAENKQYTGNINIYNDNAKDLPNIPNNSIDLIITSPPYGDSKTTVAYGEFSRLSLQWLELYGTDESSIKSIDKNLMGGNKKEIEIRNLNSETFNNSYKKICKIDDKRAKDVYAFYYDLEQIIETLSKKMKKNGYQFWVVGNRTVKLENLKTDIIIREMSKKYGITYLCTIDRNILNKVMPSKNSPTNAIGETVSTMVTEHIVVLKKEK